MTEKVSPVRSPRATFAVCAISSYISTLDLSIVNVAFFEIGQDFKGTPQSTIAWVVTAYSILFGSLLVISGRLADQVGRKKFFLYGTGFFFIGSFMCAVAPSMGLLIVGRAVQGIGGAMMTPASTGLLLAAYPPEKRPQILAWVGSIGALGVASGPTLGAFFVSAFGWRSAFWLNVPICIFVILLALRNTQESPRITGSKPDISSALIFTVAIGALVWGISRTETNGWGDASVLQLFAIAIILGLVVVWRSKTQKDPLLPPELFKEKTFTFANIATLFFGASFSGNILNNVLFQRTIWQFSATKAGWFSVLSPIVVAITSVIVGKKMATIGYRRLLIAGPLITASTIACSVLFLNVNPTPWFPFLPLMFVLGVGLGSTFPPLSACTVLSLPQTRFALGGAINNTFRQVGAAIGVALVVTVQTQTEGIEGFRNGWKIAFVFSIAAAAVSLFQPNKTKQNTH